MDNWFTIEQIDRDTFSISEYKHWEETHCYLLCGEKYAILIDTGLGVSNIRKIVDSLTKLPVMTVTTHVHWDHIGGHKYFDNIAVHEAEKDWLSVRFPIPLQVVKNNLTRLPCDFPRDFDINAYQIFQGIPQRILHRDRALGRDGHAELLFAALFGPDGAALALRKARQILHRDLVVHERLHRAGAVQLLQRVQCFYDRDRACLAHRIYLNHQTSSFGIFCCYYSTTVRPFSIVLHIAQETAGKRRFSVLREIRRKKRLRFRVFAV